MRPHWLPSCSICRRRIVFFGGSLELLRPCSDWLVRRQVPTDAGGVCPLPRYRKDVMEFDAACLRDRVLWPLLTDAACRRCNGYPQVGTISVLMWKHNSEGGHARQAHVSLNKAKRKAWAAGAVHPRCLGGRRLRVMSEVPACSPAVFVGDRSVPDLVRSAYVIPVMNTSLFVLKGSLESYPAPIPTADEALIRRWNVLAGPKVINQYRLTRFPFFPPLLSKSPL